MPPKSSAKKRGEGKQAAAAAEGSEDHSDLENPISDHRLLAIKAGYGPSVIPHNGVLEKSDAS